MRGRRRFLGLSTRLALGVVASRWPAVGVASEQGTSRSAPVSDSITLFLCGDVMLGRGIDQILPNPSDPTLHESHARSARDYVTLAERAGGALPRAVAPDYVWGDALAELARRRPDVRLINLETSITRSDAAWPKGINYRMHPDNLPCLRAAGIDACALANNHALDWGRDGLIETLRALHEAGIACAGAGANLREAQAPATLPTRDGARVLLFAAATGDSGVPMEWAADATRAGVNRLPNLDGATVSEIAAQVRRHRRERDRVVFSLHWGGNWGYAIPAEQRAFAHALIDAAGVDVVHGHSSHHAKAVEVYRDRLILYGCGDFLNDYEGIAGHEAFRGELGLMYFPVLDAQAGRLRDLSLTPTRIQRFRINRVDDPDRRWLLERLRREYRPFGGDLDERVDGSFALRWTGEVVSV